MANIVDIAESLKVLESEKKEISNISAEIDKLKEKKEILSKELPTLEEELKVWQNDISKLEKYERMESDFQTWKEEIKNIELKIVKKRKEIEDNKTKLKNKLKTEKKLNENVKNISINIKNQIFSILRDKEVMADYCRNDLIFLTEILKEILETKSKLDINTFINLILNEGIEVPLAYLELVNKVFNENLIIIPDIIPEFIADYLNNSKSGSLIDPWPWNGFMLKTIRSKIQNMTLITFKQTGKKICQNLLKDLDIDFNTDESNINYDFIVGYPPSDVITKFENDLKDLNVSDDYAAINFLNAALKLNEDGEGLFLLDNDFLLKRNPESVFSNLNNFDLYIKAIIEIPYILVSDNNEKILVIITREPQENVFVGSLSIDSDSNKILKENLIQKQTGKIPQYGYFTTLNSFFTFKSFYAHIESLKISKDLNFPTKSFIEIVKEINLPSTSCPFLDKSNSLYLPLEETMKVELQLNKINESDYIQIVLNEKNSLAEYLSIYLNETVLGRKIRESINLGKFTESLFNEIVANTELYMPDLNSQIEVLRVDSLINEIAARAASHRKQLWKKPNDYPLIIKEIESLDDKSEYYFEKWVESLPYPLASILWESFSTSKPDLKVKYLLHFFEALSEFNVILLLSGLISDERFFNQEFYRCTQLNSKFKNWIDRPSFGNWNFFGQCIGKNLQHILKDQYKRNQLLEIFGNFEPEFLSVMSSYELYNILGEVNRYRNSWDAHGPVVSPQEYKNRYKILRNSISKLYNCIGNIFKNNFLVLPLDSTYSEGIHHYTIKKFMGSRNRFISFEVDTTTPMDSNKIYLIRGNHRKPIELLPLLKYDKKTCYFYNSSIADKNKLQFVSYHNKERPEIFCPLDEIEQFYSIFEREDYIKY